MFNTDRALDLISTTRVNTTQHKQSRQSPLEMTRSEFLRAVIANYWVITLLNNLIYWLYDSNHDLQEYLLKINFKID